MTKRSALLKTKRIREGRQKEKQARLVGELTTQTEFFEAAVLENAGSFCSSFWLRGRALILPTEPITSD